MHAIELNIKGVFSIGAHKYCDSRGHFFESFNLKDFQEAVGFDGHFVQDNQSTSRRGVIRGLHFQKEPYAQGKLVRCTQGLASVKVVDIRKGSKTFGNHISKTLYGSSNMLWVPPGMAHGFISYSDNTVYQYKCTEYYHPESEMTLMWNDPDLGIYWGGIPEDKLIISEKDKKGIYLRDLENRRALL